MLDDVDQQILAFVRGEGPVTSTRIATAVGISRQAVHPRLARLVANGDLTREGAGRATRYTVRGQSWERAFPLAGLEEDRVFATLAREVATIGALSPQASHTLSYIVTELVNNAIDHSGGTEVRLQARVVGDRLFIDIEDDGVGAFAHVREGLGLEDELAAIQQLAKGKTTTAPDRHTGEGLFFASKAADVFRMESGRLAWVVDNERDDVAIATLAAPRKGTRVAIEVDTRHVRDLRSLFDAYTEGFEFSKTRVVIKLFTLGVRFVSRSEAKRLLLGLERFREAVLDFAGVDAVGQGFADEVFRVWARAHPECTLVPVRANEAVAFMIERARRSDASPA